MGCNKNYKVELILSKSSHLPIRMTHYYYFSNIFFFNLEFVLESMNNEKNVIFYYY